jgi:glycosyltransferase involved in cell wall biosynthesis
MTGARDARRRLVRARTLVLESAASDLSRRYALASPAPGMLRVLTLFHEVHALGASTSFLNAIEDLAPYGWTPSGWIPGSGPLRDAAAGRVELVLGAERPLAFSVRGWRERPGVVVRAIRTPGYLRAVRTALEHVRPHVVHANTLLSLPEAAVARACGLPVVLQAHELPPPGPKTAATVRYAAGIADVLVAVSDAVAELLGRYAGRTPVLTVRNGVPAPAAQARSDEATPFTIGSVGTVSRTKGTDVFLRAARLALQQRPDLRFEHVGAADLHRDSGLDEELAQLSADLPPAGLAMLGYSPAADVLPRWSILVCSSRSEAFPLATLEAMAMGVPVIATTVGGLPEQIDHLDNGILVRPDDPEAIATWLVRLSDDVDLRRRLGQAGADRVRREFTLERQAEGLHRAYLTALNLRFAPPRVRRAMARAA